MPGILVVLLVVGTGIAAMALGYWGAAGLDWIERFWRRVP